MTPDEKEHHMMTALVAQCLDRKEISKLVELLKQGREIVVKHEGSRQLLLKALNHKLPWGSGDSGIKWERDKEIWFDMWFLIEHENVKAAEAARRLHEKYFIEPKTIQDIFTRMNKKKTPPKPSD